MTVAAAAGRQPSLKGRRILLAEDEPLISMMMEDALLDAGALVLGPVASVPDALQLPEAALAESVCAAVLDVQLGDERATRVAEALQEHGVPFLLATGYGDRPDCALHEGVPVPGKTFNPQDMIRAAEGLCDIRI
jgi:DNA-binding NtrC family response regulator